MYDRRAIFLRAHQLRRWNPRSTIAWALRFAWGEAKAGTLPSFAPAAVAARRIAAVRMQIIEIEHHDRLREPDYRHLAALRAELGALAA